MIHLTPSITSFSTLNEFSMEATQNQIDKKTQEVINKNKENASEKRIETYHQISTYLHDLPDDKLSELLATGKFLGAGIGGSTFSIEINGIPVFIKKIALTSIEQQHNKSTHNTFNLPSYYQYGVGSMGFGTWREISTHEMTTQWVLSGECQNFPLTYHFRELPRCSADLPKLPSDEELKQREENVKYWNNSTAVAERFSATDNVVADVVVFMEHLPQTLHKWVFNELKLSTSSEQMLPNLEKELLATVEFMKSKDLLHFDAHFSNVLADNNQVYFADFGLAISKKFELSAEEKAFFDAHRDYDRYYVIAELAKTALAALATTHEERCALLDELYYAEKFTSELPPAVASIIERYRPIAILMNDFFGSLRDNDSKDTPFPEAKLAEEWNKLS